jgi:hypothetical protein
MSNDVCARRKLVCDVCQIAWCTTSHTVECHDGPTIIVVQGDYYERSLVYNYTIYNLYITRKIM